MACRINRKNSRLSNSSDIIRGGCESLKDNINIKNQVSPGNLDKNNEKHMSSISSSSSSCN